MCVCDLYTTISSVCQFLFFPLPPLPIIRYHCLAEPCLNCWALRIVDIMSSSLSSSTTNYPPPVSTPPPSPSPSSLPPLPPSLPFLPPSLPFLSFSTNYQPPVSTPALSEPMRERTYFRSCVVLQCIMIMIMVVMTFLSFSHACSLPSSSSALCHHIFLLLH